MEEQTLLNEGINWKKLCLCLIKKIWIIIGAGVAGAVIGSSLYLLITVIFAGPTEYQITGGFYITFAEGILDADDYYNAYTWNSVVHQDQIMNVVMDELTNTAYQSLTRTEIESMIQADILSDVRYMTVTITSTDGVLDQTVFDALTVALQQFGQAKTEFTSIEKTHCNAAKAVSIPDFTWRAAVLGCLVCLLISFLLWLLSYIADDSFYLPEELEDRYNLPVFGTHCRPSKNSKKEAYRKQCEEERNRNEAYINKKHESVQYVELDKITHDTNIQTYKKQDGIILQVPFGSRNGAILTRVLRNLQLQECMVLGFELVDADAGFLKQYYQTRPYWRKKA